MQLKMLSFFTVCMTLMSLPAFLMMNSIFLPHLVECVNIEPHIRIIKECFCINSSTLPSKWTPAWMVIVSVSFCAFHLKMTFLNTTIYNTYWCNLWFPPMLRHTKMHPTNGNNLALLQPALAPWEIFREHTNLWISASTKWLNENNELYILWLRQLFIEFKPSGGRTEWHIM